MVCGSGSLLVFLDLTSSNVVLEASAGDGCFLAAIPEHVTAVGVGSTPASLMKRDVTPAAA